MPYAAGLQPYDLDPELAKAELALSNHSHGFRLDIAYNAGNALRRGAAELVKRGLEGLNASIRVTLRPLESAQLEALAAQGGLAATFAGWAADDAFPDGYVVAFGHSARGTYARWAGLRDPVQDALIDQALRETDALKLRQEYGAIQQHMHDAYEYLWLYQSDNVHVEGPWALGYQYHPMDAGQPNVGRYREVDVNTTALAER
jgi:ABC-type transport system substrate-binding protein